MPGFIYELTMTLHSSQISEVGKEEIVGGGVRLRYQMIKRTWVPVVQVPKLYTKLVSQQWDVEGAESTKTQRHKDPQKFV